MAESPGTIMVWSGSVSAAAAGLAALFAAGKTSLDHILFACFSIIGVTTFVILLGVGIPAAWWHFRSHGKRATESAGVREVHPDSPAGSGKWVQDNVAKDHGRLYAAQGGNVIVHQSGPEEPPSASPQGEENDSAENE